MRNFFSLIIQRSGKSAALVQVRERLLKIMLISSSVVGTLLFGLAMIPAIQKGLYSLILVYSLLYVWIILITVGNRLPYTLRAIGWLGILYLLGNLNLYISGFNVDAGLFFITFIAMSVLFIDLRGGFAALVLVSVSISTMGFLNTKNNIQLPVGLPQSDPMLWIIGGLIFVLMGILLIYSLTIVLHDLEDNLSRATLLAGQLEHTNQSLRLSEARYRTLIETSPSMVYQLDVQGNIVMANQFGLKLFGYERLEEVAGKNLLTFVAPDDQAHVTDSFQKTLEEGLPSDLRFLAIRKDGSTFAGEFNAALVKDEAGMPQTVIGVGRDITERQEAEQALLKTKDSLAEMVVETTVKLQETTDRLQEMASYGPTIIYSFRPSDRAITYISENVSAILGYEPGSFTQDGNFWRDHIHPDDMLTVSDRMALPENQETSVFETRFLKKDGTYCWLRGERKLLFDTDGNPLEYIGSLADITRRKIAEETLKRSEARYRSLYESMMDAYVQVDMDGRIQLFNHAYEKMLGYGPDDLRKLTYRDLTPPRWQALENEIVENQVLPLGYSDIYEKEYIRKDGSVFPVELRTVLVHDDAGNPSGMWAIVRDISERKVIEGALRESEARYRELLDHSMQGVFVFQDTRILYANQAVTDSFGYTSAELTSFSPAEILQHIYPDDRPLLQERWLRPMESFIDAERYPLRILNKKGEVCWLEARTLPISFQGKPSVLTTTIDVTHIRRVEAELQESEQTQRSIVNASDALVLLVDTQGALISANDRFMARMGLSENTARGTSVFNLLPEGVQKLRQATFDQVLSSGKPATLTDSNADRWFENNFYPILDKSGKVVRIAIYARDITEQRRVTEELRLSEEKYRTLTETAHDMIFIIDRQDRIAYVNSFGANFLGQSPHQLVGQPRARYFPEDTSLHQESSIQQVLRTGEPVSAESETNFPSGPIWLNTWLVPLKDNSGVVNSILGVSRDITERKRSEVALAQARDRLEERVAQRTNELLASQEQLRFLTAQTIKAQEEERRSISRELHDEAGQALITLQYSLSEIQSELPEKDLHTRQRLSESLTIINQTMSNIRSLAHSLRPPVLDVVGINLSLKEYCREQSERTHIPIFYQGQDIPGLPDQISISVYRFVQEALTNILKHARATQVKVRLEYKKRELWISVADNGRGMEDPTRSDGLGLLGIKERFSLLGGRLDIHSQKGRGARLVVRVPWSKSSPG